MNLNTLEEITKKYQPRIDTLRRQYSFLQLMGMVMNTMISLATIVMVFEKANGVQDCMLFSFIGFVAMIVHNIAHDNALDSNQKECKAIQECIKEAMKQEGVFEDVRK